jgi:hypothetical protein
MLAALYGSFLPVTSLLLYLIYLTTMVLIYKTIKLSYLTTIGILCFALLESFAISFLTGFTLGRKISISVRRRIR